MRAAYIERLGPAEEIRCGPLPDPVPGPTDVLVEVTATTVNPVDTFVRSGLFPTPLPMPFVVGRDLVGTVLSTNGRVTGFAPGDVVWCDSLGHAGRQGAAAERAVVPMERLYRVPPGVQPRAAVAAVFPAGTAYLALFTHGRLRAGDTVIVEGAAGHVGAALVAFAVDAGARVVATAAADDAAYCTALGADEVVDYRAADRLERLAAACPGGAALYLDTSGRNDLAAALDLLAFRGRIVVLAGAASRPVLPVTALYMHDRTVSGFVISHATVAELAEAAVATNRMLTAGKLRPRATVDLPLSATAEAHAMIERGELRGRRIIITPGD